jgi:hypothetical protein
VAPVLLLVTKTAGSGPATVVTVEIHSLRLVSESRLVMLARMAAATAIDIAPARPRLRPGAQSRRASALDIRVRGRTNCTSFIRIEGTLHGKHEDRRFANHGVTDEDTAHRRAVDDMTRHQCQHSGNWDWILLGLDSVFIFYCCCVIICGFTK